MKIFKKIIIIPLILASILIGIILLPVFFSVSFQIISYFTMENPDVPVIKKGEFPFEIIYEVNGERFSIKDTYVCEYDGIQISKGGKYLGWKGYFKSGNKDPLTIFIGDTTEIVIDIGDYWYYMGDPILPKSHKNRIPAFGRVIRENGGISGEALSSEELYSEYGIKIISCSLPEPIENTFVPKKWYEFWKQ